MSKFRTALCATLIALTLPATAGAASRPILPSGNSGISQYIESVPTAGGSRATGTVRNSASTKQHQGSVSSATQRTLLHDGSTGAQAASFAAATAPPGARRYSAGRSRAPGRTRSRSTAAVPAAQPPGGSSSGSGTGQSSAVVSALTGGGGGGISALPIVLIAIAAVVVAIRLRRRTAAD